MEPRKQQQQAGARGVPRVVSVLAGLLERAAERGDGEGEGECDGSPASSASAFRGKALPSIPVRRYAERIYRYAGCSPACFVVAYVYLDRLAQRPRPHDGEDEEQQQQEQEAVLGVDSYSVHRLLITSVMVAAKFVDDMHYNNAYFARVGGVEVAEMNALELELLFALGFRLNVTPATFARYCAALEGHVQLMAQVVDHNPGSGDTAAAAIVSVSPPLPCPEEEEAEAVLRRRRGHQRQQAALRITHRKKAAAAVYYHQVGAVGRSRTAAASASVAVVVSRAAVEMAAR